MAQKKRKMSLIWAQVIQEQVESLLEAGFIQEIMYSSRLSNIVMEPKSNREVTNVHRLHQPKKKPAQRIHTPC